MATIRNARKRPVTREQRTFAPSDDACPSCGTLMKETRARLCLTVNDEEVPVTNALHLKCPRCREIVLRGLDARRLRESALDAYRRKYGLLTADEIRLIREKFRLTQSALAKLLHLGANTISRWESGRNVQTAAMDVLLRMLRDLPGSLEYLRRRAA